MSECECTEEYGPCEIHGETLVSREGASLRTADELCALFIEDALSVGAELSVEGAQILYDANEALSESSWIEDPDLAEALRDLVNQVESYIADLTVVWDDGYRIIRPTDDCPLYAD
jgi:hypothetical protein